ncbi:MAG: flap endonuclease-1 [Nanoarchaeota archaeon]|nr:flap endonuclease-1 [Nanoarchaeota archaeon]
MGVAISELVPSSEVSLDSLAGKIIAIDAMNMLYQFVTTIRQQDGTPLKDSKGNITSHLTGLFARTTRLMQKGIRLVFVFDGKMPELKAKERERREKLKEEAHAALQESVAAGDIAGMKKFAGRTARVTSQMIEESKELLDALGIPYLVAPSEGEAQAGFMVKQGDCDYVASQDSDCLIYDSPAMIKNLSLSNRRKKINALTYKAVLPEAITLEETLSTLGINLDQLRALAMLIGTDFNIGGIKGLGPKKGLKLVKEFGDDFKALFAEVKWDDHFEVSWQDVFDTIKNMPTTTEYSLSWKDVDADALKRLLVEEHDFSKARVDSAIEEIEKAKKKSQQTSLGRFFG